MTACFSPLPPGAPQGAPYKRFAGLRQAGEGDGQVNAGVAEHQDASVRRGMADCTTRPCIPATRVDLHAPARDISAMPPRTSMRTFAGRLIALVLETQYRDAVLRLHEARMS